MAFYSAVTFLHLNLDGPSPFFILLWPFCTYTWMFPPPFILFFWFTILFDFDLFALTVLGDSCHLATPDVIHTNILSILNLDSNKYQGSPSPATKIHFWHFFILLLKFNHLGNSSKSPNIQVWCPSRYWQLFCEKSLIHHWERLTRPKIYLVQIEVTFTTFILN